MKKGRLHPKVQKYMGDSGDNASSPQYKSPLNTQTDSSNTFAFAQPTGLRMVKGIGIDVEAVSRIAALVNRYDRTTLNLLFTPGEIDRCQLASDPHIHYAACFSTKEAVGKALGTGLAGIGWNEIEATVTDFKLTIDLYGEASRQASKCGVQEWVASWCHWDDYVLVHVLAQ
jgi:holo-[acyl-carrier protein] synthase